MKKLGWVNLVLAMVLVLLVGCGTKESANKHLTNESDRKESLVLSFGAMPAVDSLPVYIAEKEGYFKEEGLNLELNSFKSLLYKEFYYVEPKQIIPFTVSFISTYYHWKCRCRSFLYFVLHKRSF